MNERIANMGRLAQEADDEAASPDCEPWEREWFKQRAQMYRDEQAAQIARTGADGALLEMGVEHGASLEMGVEHGAECDAEGHRRENDPDLSMYMEPFLFGQYARQDAIGSLIVMARVAGLVALWVWCKKEGWL